MEQKSNNTITVSSLIEVDKHGNVILRPPNLFNILQRFDNIESRLDIIESKLDNLEHRLFTRGIA